MNKNQVCIVIPIYKQMLNDYEIQSVLQCINILSNYAIYFVAPQGLDITFYESHFERIQETIFFGKNYFMDLRGYNKLMLNIDFYKTFQDFEYMLIYQTDCYVFRDELLNWVHKDFDYIGGIWFDGFVGNPYLGAKIWKAGNGGLSLRKIDSAIRILSSRKPVKNFTELFKEKRRFFITNKLKFISELFFLPLNILGYKNNFSYSARNYNLNEDFFFTEMFEKHNDFKMPLLEEALLFSWDRHPSYLYNYLDDIPFGCHAWFRDDFPYEQNKKFWLTKIN